MLMRIILIIFLNLFINNACAERSKETLNNLYNSIDVGDSYKSVSSKVSKYCESNYVNCFTYEEDKIKSLREHQRNKCNSDLKSIFLVTQLDQEHDIRATDPTEFYRYIYIGSQSTVCDKESFSRSG